MICRILIEKCSFIIFKYIYRLDYTSQCNAKKELKELVLINSKHDLQLKLVVSFSTGAFEVPKTVCSLKKFQHDSPSYQ